MDARYPGGWAGSLVRAVGLLAAVSVFSLASSEATAARVKNAEKGRDVGDGVVLYATPYDPARVDAMMFVSPTAAHPYYEVVVPVGEWAEGKSARVTKVTVNGLSCESYYVFVDGVSHVQSAWITDKSATAHNVVLVARTLWHSGEGIVVEATLSATGDDGKSKTVEKSFEGRAPRRGGGPAGWRRYQSFVLEERAGLARSDEPVEFSVVARAENCGDLEREIRLFRVDAKEGALEPVNFQTFNAREFGGTPPGTADDYYLYNPSRSVDVVFLASVPAKSSGVYVVTYDNPDAEMCAAQATDLTVSGPPLGAVVENRFLRVKLDDKCGQVVSFELKGRSERPAPLLSNSYSLAAHWNPDSFSDNGKWGHTFAWDPPEHTVVTANGPILFRVTNSGRMPEYTPQVWASVTYSFYASTPYVKVKTTTQVRDPLNASAIRNGELVLDSHLVTHFVWKEKAGGVRRVRAVHGPDWQDEWTTTVEHDVPWIAMTNEFDDYGVGAVVQSSLAFNAKSGEATTHRSAYYLYVHHFWAVPLTYFTRAWVYPFSDYQRGPILPVEPGSTYVEDMAFVPFFLHHGRARYGEIERANTVLKQPLVQRWGR